jgi:hypothetical protein
MEDRVLGIKDKVDQSKTKKYQENANQTCKSSETSSIDQSYES